MWASRYTLEEKSRAELCRCLMFRRRASIVGPPSFALGALDRSPCLEGVSSRALSDVNTLCRL